MRDPNMMKADATAFYDLMFNQSRPRQAVEQYAGARAPTPSRRAAIGRHDWRLQIKRR